MDGQARLNGPGTPMYLDGVRVDRFVIEDDLPVRVRIGDPYDGPELTIQLVPPEPEPPEPPAEPPEPPEPESSAAIRRRAAADRLAPVEDPIRLVVRQVEVKVGARRLPGPAWLRRLARWAGIATTPTTLLHDVSFAVEPGRLVGVIGPSGAGKTTLLKALIGAQQPTAGSVTYNGHELSESLGTLRYRIGYVPQDDILHTQLQLRRALRYSAALRVAGDGREDRERKVEQTLSDLSLARTGSGDEDEPAGAPIGRISGGERKRASVAPELLTRPAVLFLDEPTTWLDPDAERRLMEFLRRLADEGRHTVVVITHAAAVLYLCHQVLVIGRARGKLRRLGGRMAYFGPPEGALRFFGAKDFAHIYQELREGTSDWASKFAHTEEHRANVVEPVHQKLPKWPLGSPRRVGAARQLVTLSARNVAVIAGTWRYAALLCAQAPVMAGLLLFALGTGGLSGSPDEQPRNLLVFLVVAALAMGLVNACREIVKELPVYRRERTVGLSLRAYLGSKFLCLGVLSAAQSLALMSVVALQDGPDTGLLLSAFSELWLILFAATVTAVAMGLAISALVSADSTALVMVPVILVAQLLLSNAFLEIEDRPGLAQVGQVTPAYWAFAAAAASTDLLELEHRCPATGGVEDGAGSSRRPDDRPPGGGPAEGAAQPAPRGPTGELACSERWRHERGNLVVALTMLGLLTSAYAGTAAVALRRRDVLRVHRAGRPSAPPEPPRDR